MPTRKFLILAAAFAALLPVAAAGAREVGSNDFRISQMGPDGLTGYRPGDPVVTYNSLRHEYLVAWQASDPVDGHGIHVQRLGAASGEELGTDDLKIASSEGQIGLIAVAYDTRRDIYLVVWAVLFADRNEGIYGRRLDGATGQPLGTADFAIAVGGPYEGFGQHRSPAVLYNPKSDEYLVAWRSDAGVFQVQGEREIFVRRIDGPSGLPSGAVRRISSAGGYGDAAFSVGNPAVAHDPRRDRYLVVWQANRDDPPHRLELYGQLLAGSTLTEEGADDGRLSPLSVGDRQRVDVPDVAYSRARDAFLAVYPIVLADSTWIEGRWVDPVLGLPSAVAPLLLNSQDSADRRPARPALAMSPPGDTALVVWEGWSPDQVLAEAEIIGRFLGADGSLLSGELRFSDAGGTGNASFRATQAATVWSGVHEQALTVWRANEDHLGLHDFEFEIYGQRLASPHWIFADGFEAGDLSAWAQEAR